MLLAASPTTTQVPSPSNPSNPSHFIAASSPPLTSLPPICNNPNLCLHLHPPPPPPPPSSNAPPPQHHPTSSLAPAHPGLANDSQSGQARPACLSPTRSRCGLLVMLPATMHRVLFATDRQHALASKTMQENCRYHFPFLHCSSHRHSTPQSGAATLTRGLLAPNTLQQPPTSPSVLRRRFRPSASRKYRHPLSCRHLVHAASRIRRAVAAGPPLLSLDSLDACRPLISTAVDVLPVALTLSCPPEKARRKPISSVYS